MSDCALYAFSQVSLEIMTFFLKRNFEKAWEVTWAGSRLKMQVWHPKLSQLKYIYHLISNSPLILKKPWNKNIASVTWTKGKMHTENIKNT